MRTLALRDEAKAAPQFIEFQGERLLPAAAAAEAAAGTVVQVFG
ncbi:MAG TPA: hypothetical protein VMK12_06415 [Anaeromyxobacteraceae bacterium]|nr:hypothetical protein [Anaeromyxobacteraceae bacterium]